MDVWTSLKHIASASELHLDYRMGRIVPIRYTHPYYAGRRLWRAFSLWAPSQNFDPKLGVEVDRPTYPFSVKLDELITLEKMKSLYRDHMEGTQYDLTMHVTAGGAFGTPNRYTRVL